MSALRVLVVDDEQDIRDLCAAVIERRRPGTHVQTASDAASALALVAGSPCDVLLTDYRMPGGTGLELAVEAVRLDAPPRCVLMSAYADRALASEAIATGAVATFLVKPFSAEDLVNVIDHLADPTGPDGKRAIRDHFQAVMQRLAARA